MKVNFTVNGRAHELDCHGLRRLIDIIRIDLGLTGTKEGCSEGECGACSVMLDGVLVCSCLIPAAQIDGREVRTIEGFGFTPEDLTPLQTAMMESGGAQCGICTPGMIMAGADFLARAERTRQTVDRESIRRAVAGNLCRCTGYVKIVDAIATAWERRHTAKKIGDVR